MTAYLRMLVQNRLAAIKPGSYAKEGKPQALAVLKVVGFGLLMLIAYGSIAFLEVMLFDLLHGVGQGQAAIGLALLACTMITLLYGFFHLNSVLFFSRDTSFLASLPIESRTVLLGKVLTVIAGEAGISLLFSAPFLVCYGISISAGLVYYLKAVLVFLLVPLIPLAIAMLLSFALIRISALWKRREGMTTLVSLALFVGIMAAELSLQNMSNEEITQWLLSLLLGRESLGNMLLRNLPWLRWANDCLQMAGMDSWMRLGLYAVTSAAVIGGLIWLLGGGYMKLAIRQEEAIGQVNRGKKRVLGKQGERKPIMSLTLQEIKHVLTVPIYATNCLIGILMVPLMAGVFAFSLLQDGGIQFIRNVLLSATGEYYLAILTGVLALTGMMNLAPSTAVSREGTVHEFRKTFPISGAVQLRAKVYMGLFFDGILILLLCTVLWILVPALWLRTLIAGVCALLICLLMSTLSVIIDVHYPKLHWKTEVEAVKQNFMSMVAMLLNILILGLLFLLFGTLMTETDFGWYAAYGLTMGTVLLLTVLSLLWLNNKGEKAYHAH